MRYKPRFTAPLSNTSGKKRENASTRIGKLLDSTVLPSFRQMYVDSLIELEEVIEETNADPGILDECIQEINRLYIINEIKEPERREKIMRMIQVNTSILQNAEIDEPEIRKRKEQKEIEDNATVQLESDMYRRRKDMHTLVNRRK